VPLGYVAFVGVPILLLFVIYYLVNSNDKPARTRGENVSVPPDQTAPNQKPLAGQEPKRKPNFSPQLPTQNDLSSTPPITTEPQGTKPDTPLAHKTEVSADSIAPPPRELKEFGTLRLTTLARVKDGVQAWVEIDGERKANFQVGSTQVELRLVEGRYGVKVVSIYQSKRLTIYEGEVEITANRVKEVPVEKGK
jgi:hypothetical protein